MIKDLYDKFVDLKGVNIKIEDYDEEYSDFVKLEVVKCGQGAYGYVKKFFIRKKYKELNKEEFEKFRNTIYTLYYENQYGLKTIGKKTGISYSKIRNLFNILEIDFHKGRSVVTDRLKQIRKENAISSGGWRDRQTKNKYSERGIQGYYFNESQKKYVWLRSTYEYIIAKWLDANNHIWDVECKSFWVNSNEKYTPDFFIYENNKISSIIEVKGYWKNRVWKFEKLKSLFNNTSISVILIDKIEPYLKQTTYKNELKCWKNLKLLELK